MHDPVSALLPAFDVFVAQSPQDCHFKGKYSSAVTLSTHLVLTESRVLPGEEWRGSADAWKVVLVRQGFVYWLRGTEVQELNCGDVAAIGPSEKGVLRASRIAAAAIWHFNFRPEHVADLLSLTERIWAEKLAGSDFVRIFPATHAIATAFGELANSEHRSRVLDRCRMLKVVGLLLEEAAPANVAADHGRVIDADARLEQVIAEIPDSELMTYPCGKLAELCGCSARHFRRLFRRRFNTSVREKQTELRLQKARRLLEETDETVGAIARLSGYRHAGFFSALFKARFRVTPGKWRQRNT